MVAQDGQIQESTNLSSAAQKFQKDLEHAIAVKEQTIQYIRNFKTQWSLDR